MELVYANILSYLRTWQPWGKCNLQLVLRKYIRLSRDADVFHVPIKICLFFWFVTFTNAHLPEGGRKKSHEDAKKLRDCCVWRTLRANTRLRSFKRPPPPRTSSLHLLHYAIKSAITILDAGLQMSQITIRLERENLLATPSKLPIPHTQPFCSHQRDVRVKMKGGRGWRIKDRSPCYWFLAFIIASHFLPLSGFLILSRSYT